MKYSEAVEKLHSKGMFSIEPGLERISKVLNAFDNPQDKLKFIHVAGTNGKGSVCAILDSVLKEAGYKTGLYSSPHIFEYTERIKISGKEISKNDFAKYFEEISAKIQELNTYLTEFEMLTVIMFLYFQKNNVDVVILETGMGGRLDATNVIKKNICSVITRIDIDHTNFLGDTKEKIAYEKAGIIKPDCPVVTLADYAAIRDKANEMNSLLILTHSLVYKEFLNSLSLKGKQQEENLSVALTVINNFFKEISYETILKGLKKVKNPYRFEYFKNKNLIVDVAHNPNGITALRENLDTFYPTCMRRFVFGCLRTKDYEKMMKILFREGDEIFLYGFDYPSACTYEELSSKCPYPAQKFNINASKLTPDKLNIICGSFYYLKDLKEKGII